MEGAAGDAVRRARERARLSQRDLAKRSGVPQPNIAAIESGRRSPSPATLSRLLSAARMRPSDALSLHRDDVLRIVAARRGHDPRAFGSVARGTDTHESDLDLLVRFEPGTTVWDVVGAELDLEEALGVEVDVIPDDGDSPVLAQARREAVPL